MAPRMSFRCPSILWCRDTHTRTRTQSRRQCSLQTPFLGGHKGGSVHILAEAQISPRWVGLGRAELLDEEVFEPSALEVH